MRKSKSVVLATGLYILLNAVVSCHKKGSVNKSSQTDSLAQVFFPIIDSSGSPTPGIILAAPIVLGTAATVDTTGTLLIMNQDGQILKRKTVPGEAYNFRRWIINGNIRYTYALNDPTAFRVLSFGNAAGYEIIADSNLNTLQRVDFTPYGDGLFQDEQPLDLHDFILLSDNDYITESYVVKPVNNIPDYIDHSANVEVAAPVIEEVNNGSVVWSWDGSNDTAFYGNSRTGNVYTDPTTVQDYVHLNSVFIDPRDNNIIISMRNQCQVAKINRQTGLVMWRLGGKNSDFPMDSSEVFLYQHNATLVDSNNTLMIFDDGDPTLRPYSRICEFQLDETNKTITGFKSFTIPEAFSEIMGSVQKFGNEYFIGGGSGDYILDINYVTGQKVLEMKSNVCATYRAFKY